MTCAATLAKCSALLLLLLLGAGTAVAQPAAGHGATPGAAPDATRPRVALVLSGGGARGFAHVGVLRALQELRVPVDFVVGASMGAVVGAAHASGRSVEEMEAFVRRTDWSDIVADRAPRDDLAFRRREDDLLVPSRLEFGIGTGGVLFPPGAAANAALEAALHRLLPNTLADRPLDRLALPFRCVASDLLNGELVELADTPLLMSVRASLAVPGVFAPVRVRGRLVVDGGLVRNLPVDIARAMGAEVIIAVNVGTPLAGEAELLSGIGVARQMLNILTEQNVQRSLKELTERDILIAPDLSAVTFLDFSRSEDAMEAGARAAHQAAARLQALAVPPAAYAALEGTRRRAASPDDDARTLARVEIEPTLHAGRAALEAQFELRSGDTASSADLAAAAGRLYSHGSFERVGVEIRDDGDRRDVVVRPVEAAWARSRLRLGVELVSDFDDDNRFTISALHVLSWLNPWGAELRTLARIGDQRSIMTQAWQPLAPGSKWFVTPSLGYQESALDVYDEEQRAARIGYHATIVSLAAGRQVSNWGNVQLGIERRLGRARVLLGDAALLPQGRIGETARYLQLQVDTLDSLALPSRGVLLQGRLSRTASSAGSESRSTSTFVGLWAFRAGGWDSHVYAEWAKAGTGLAPVSLGGFLRLTGTPRESISGRSIALARLVMAQRFGAMPAGLGGAIRAGYSLEAGDGYDDREPLRAAGLRRAASVFVVVDTRFGPVFFGIGGTRGVGSAVYLFLGPFW